MTGTRQKARAIFLAAIMLVSVVGMTTAFAGTAAASSENPDPVVDPGELEVSLTDGDGTVNATYRINHSTNTINVSYTGDKQDVNKSFSSGEGAKAIQLALDDTSGENDTVIVGPGTYNASGKSNGALQINNDGISLLGDGNSPTIKGDQNGDAFEVNSNSTTIKGINIDDYLNGIQVDGSAIQNLNIIDTSISNESAQLTDGSSGVEINRGSVDGLQLDNVTITETDNGFRVASTASVDGLIISNSEFSDNGIGMYLAHPSQYADDPPGDDEGLVQNVSIQNTDFLDHADKGIYAETLDDATLSNILVDGITDDDYGYNTGIDINLKDGSYENITIEDSVVSNITKGTPSDDAASTAVAIKARDDGGYGGKYAATLDDVTIDNLSVTDSFNGLRIGEFDTDYSGSGEPTAPTNVSVINSQFRNNSGYHIKDVANATDLNTVRANNNNKFDQIVTSNLGLYSSIQTAVDNAESGDTVSVGPGTYNESVDISTQNVTLVGPNAGTPGDTQRGDEATIQQGVKLNASEVTLDGVQVLIDGTNAVRIGPEVVPDNVTIQNNVVTNVGGGDFLRDNTPTGAGNGIQVQFASGEPEGETAENLRILNNDINNVTTLDTPGGTTAVGINILPRGNNVDLEIRGNTIRDIEPGASSNDEAQARAISIDTQDDAKSGDGRVNGVVIENNTITDLSADDDVWAISIFEDGALSPKEGVENFTIRRNTFDNFDADVEEVALFVGGYADLGQDHSFVRNNVQDGAIARIGGDNANFDMLNADLNWWGTDRGPTGSPNTSVSSGVVYDPFLTTPIENLEVDDVGDTKQFAQDIEAPADQDITAVGFPGPTDQTIGDAFGNFDGTIYEYNTETDEFEIVNDGDREINSLDAFIITQNSSTTNEDVQVVLEYADAPDNPGSPGTKTIEPGFNLVGARGLGDSYDIFNAPTDREVIYGTYGQPADRSETALLMTENADSNFIESTFGPEQDDPVVTPYGGYLVYTEEQRSITTYVQTGVTADEVITNLNQTAA